MTSFILFVAKCVQEKFVLPELQTIKLREEKDQLIFSMIEKTDFSRFIQCHYVRVAAYPHVHDFCQTVVSFSLISTLITFFFTRSLNRENIRVSKQAKHR